MWNFDKFAGNTAVITENGDNISYFAFGERCADLTRNIPHRCLVFNLCKNELGSLVGYVGFLNARIVPLMLKADLDVGLLHELIEKYKPDYIHAPVDMAEQFSNCKCIYQNLGYVLLKTEFDRVYPLHDDLALLLTTSGSTGSPKLVRQSYRNIEANTSSIVQYLGLTESERTITTLPMNYTYGISIINTHLAVGAAIILTEKALMQKEFWQQLKDFEATSFGGVPYTFEMLNRLRFERMNLPALKCVTQAGGKLSLVLHKKFAKWAADAGRKFIVMYGQTEATARMSYLPAEKSLEKCGSIGIAIPGGRFALLGENGVEITEADGYYYIVGRKKRFLKIFGNRVNLDETERLLKGEFPNCDFACAGVDDRMSVFVTDEKIKDVVLPFLTDKLKFHASAFKVCFINAIPRNESGKVLYKDLPEGA